MATTEVRNGRQAQAARNDQRILEAAREIFTADPEAPIAAVAAQAGVGISALYRRYHSKEGLLQCLCLDGLRRYIAEAEEAIAAEGDCWAPFSRFMRRCLEDGAGSLTLRFAGTFTAGEELQRAGGEAYAVTARLLDKARAAGVLRTDIEVSDIALLFEQLQSVQVLDLERSRALRQRYLALMLDALHGPSHAVLPGPAPQWPEISRRYSS